MSARGVAAVASLAVGLFAASGHDARMPTSVVSPAVARQALVSAVVVLDGGSRVTLSGGDQRRILYMNTCDQAQIWTTSHCQNQAQPQLTIQGMGFTQGNSTGDLREGGGGGAIFVRGGRVKVLGSTRPPSIRSGRQTRGSRSASSATASTRATTTSTTAIEASSTLATSRCPSTSVTSNTRD